MVLPHRGEPLPANAPKSIGAIAQLVYWSMAAFTRYRATFLGIPLEEMRLPEELGMLEMIFLQAIKTPISTLIIEEIGLSNSPLTLMIIPPVLKMGRYSRRSSRLGVQQKVSRRLLMSRWMINPTMALATIASSRCIMMAALSTALFKKCNWMVAGNALAYSPSPPQINYKF